MLTLSIPRPKRRQLMPSIYAAGKTWHAAIFRQLRDLLGYNIIARWIYLDPNSDFVANEKGKLWAQCLEDATTADITIVYCGNPNEEQRGALVEIGHALAAGKFVYLINSCKTFEANDGSDVAFTHHPRFVRIKTEKSVAARIGYRLAIRDWQQRQASEGLGAKAG